MVLGLIAWNPESSDIWPNFQNVIHIHAAWNFDQQTSNKQRWSRNFVSRKTQCNDSLAEFSEFLNVLLLIVGSFFIYRSFFLHFSRSPFSKFGFSCINCKNDLILNPPLLSHRVYKIQNITFIADKVGDQFTLLTEARQPYGSWKVHQLVKIQQTGFCW